MSSDFDIPSALKGAQWEVTKGQIRAWVSIQGSHASGGSDTVSYQRFKRIRTMAEEFITAVEDKGFNE